jgi:predicted transcriptional regulator
MTMRKPGPPRDIPPPLELECLRILWKLGEGNVKDVRASLAARRDLAYTTVMTLLDRLVRRGSATRRKIGRSFLYTPLVSRETLQSAAVRELLDWFFDGSSDSLLVYLGGKPSLPVAPPQPASAAKGAGQEESLDTALL